MALRGGEEEWGRSGPTSAAVAASAAPAAGSPAQPGAGRREVSRSIHRTWWVEVLGLALQWSAERNWTSFFEGFALVAVVLFHTHILAHYEMIFKRPILFSVPAVVVGQFNGSIEGIWSVFFLGLLVCWSLSNGFQSCLSIMCRLLLPVLNALISKRRR